MSSQRSYRLDHGLQIRLGDLLRVEGTAWSDHNGWAIYLAAGEHQLTLRHDGGSGANVDWLRLDGVARSAMH